MTRWIRFLALVALPLAVACSSKPQVHTEPVTAADLEDWHRRPPEGAGRIESRGALFTTLDQNLKTWGQLKRSRTERELLLVASLEEAMSRLVVDNFDTIVQELQAGDPEWRVVAAGALGFVAIVPPNQEPAEEGATTPLADRALLPLIAVLDEGNDRLTRNALISLWMIGSPDTPLELLLEILVTHHDEEVRANASLVLARVLQPENAGLALSPLYAALNDGSDKVRVHVVSALGRLQVKSSVGQLIDLLKRDPVPLVQANAARVLGQLGDLQAVPYLAGALYDSNRLLRTYCHMSLIELVGEDLGMELEPWQEWYERTRETDEGTG